MKNTSFTLLFFFLMSMSYAQEEPKKSIKVSSFNMSFGTSRALLSSSKTEYMTLKSMVDDPDLFVNPDDFSNSYYFQDVEDAISTKVQIGITPFNKKLGELNDNQELRIGIGMNSGSRRSFSFHNTETIVVDTFYSTNGNPDIYKEQKNSIDYFYSEEYTELNFNIAYLFKTDTQKRLHLYFGFGAEYGFTLQSFVEVFQIESSWINYQTPDHNSNSHFYQSNSSGREFNGKEDRTNISSTTHYVRVYIPLGINFRFSNNNSFFKHLNIYSELNPGVEIQMAPKNNIYTNPYLGFAFIGLKYTF